MNDRLYRSRHDRVLAGVAGGLAERLDLDPSVVRIVWALLAIVSGGVLFLLYIVMAIVVPEAPDGYEPSPGARWTPEGAWQPPSAAPDDATTVGPSGPAGSAETGPAGAGSASVPLGAAGTPGGPPSWTAPPTRAELRAQRRAARRNRRSGDGALIVGLLLVLVGGYFLVRRYVPGIDTDLLWPIAIVALGIVLLAAAVRPGPGRPPGP